VACCHPHPHPALAPAPTLALTPTWPQVVALLYYLSSYFPGGAQGVKFMLQLAYTAAGSALSGVQRMVMR
jgi:hypothetical protein